MPGYERFLWGMAGSIAVDVLIVWRDLTANSYILPSRYRRLSFYVIRLCMAMVGGGIAMGSGLTNPLLLLHIGAATPLIVQRFAKTPPPLE